MKNKKLKYSSLAALYTILIIAVVVVLNIIISAVGDRFYSVFYPDISPEKLYEISSTTDDLFELMLSDMSKDQLDKLNENKVTLTFMLSEAEASVSNDEKYRQIYEMAKQYASKYSFIQLDFVEPDKNPELVQKFLTYSSTKDSSAINRTDIYFSGPSGQYLSIPYLHFFNSMKESGGMKKVICYNIESKMTGTILRLFSTDSIAYLVKGHGENTEIDRFRELLGIAGFTVEEIDLSDATKELDNEKGKIVIINSPKKDFVGVNDEGKPNELEKLRKFLSYDKSTHHMMVFIDPEDATQGRLSELLSFMKNYGFTFNANTVSDPTKGLGGNEKIIDATYVTKDISTANSEGYGALGYSIIEKLSSLKTVISNSGTVSISPVKSSSLNDEYFVDSIITASGSAKATELEGEGKTSSAAYATLLGISGHEMLIDNAAFYTSYVVAGGSSSFISDEYLQKYANIDIMYSILRTMSLNDESPVSQQIGYKQYQSSGLTMTIAEQMTWIIIMAAILPLIIMGTGVVVFVRRRNS